MSYGEVVRKIRASQPTKNGRIMSYVDFSKITGISAAQLERLEKEQSNPPVMKLKPTIDSLKRLCERTNYPFRQFLEEAGYIEPVEVATVIGDYANLTVENKQRVDGYIQRIYHQQLAELASNDSQKQIK